MNIQEGKMTITLDYKDITLFKLLEVKSPAMRERQMKRGRRRHTAILTLSCFFSSPYPAVLS